jgi:hypothetical protein
MSREHSSSGWAHSAVGFDLASSRPPIAWGFMLVLVNFIGPSGSGAAPWEHFASGFVRALPLRD